MPIVDPLLAGPTRIGVPTIVPAAVRATVTHRRTTPFAYGFRHRTTLWLFDAAHPNAAFPRWLRPLARVRPEDHFASNAEPLLAKVRSFLASEGLTWSTDRVLGLAAARSLGHVFDPLSVWFCFDEAGTVQGVLAEVHNTYGERHCYPLPVSPGGFSVDKAFYVSPFFTVDGRYDLAVALDDKTVSVAITLTQGDRVAFTGAVRGALRPVVRRTSAIVEVLRDPAPSLRVATLIRWHGMRLWLRRLPVVRRRPHNHQEGMS